METDHLLYSIVPELGSACLPKAAFPAFHSRQSTKSNQSSGAIHTSINKLMLKNAKITAKLYDKIP
jgi:hypothetical protein